MHKTIRCFLVTFSCCQTWSAEQMTRLASHPCMSIHSRRHARHYTPSDCGRCCLQVRSQHTNVHPGWNEDCNHGHVPSSMDGLSNNDRSYKLMCHFGALNFRAPLKGESTRYLYYSPHGEHSQQSMSRPGQLVQAG